MREVVKLQQTKLVRVVGGAAGEVVENYGDMNLSDATLKAERHKANCGIPDASFALVEVKHVEQTRVLATF